MSDFADIQRPVATGVTQAADQLYTQGWNHAIEAMQAKLRSLEPAFGTDTLSSFYALFEGMKK